MTLEGTDKIITMEHMYDVEGAGKIMSAVHMHEIFEKLKKNNRMESEKFLQMIKNYSCNKFRNCK